MGASEHRSLRYVNDLVNIVHVGRWGSTRGRPSVALAAVLGAVLLAAACSGDELALRRTVAGEASSTASGLGPAATDGSGPAARPAGGAAGVDALGPGPGGQGPATPAGPAAPAAAVPPQRGATDRASDRGVTDDRIRIGVITTLSGGQRFVGEPPYRTALAYAADVNRRGGINGRQVEVIGYDVCIACPEDGLAQAKRAVEEDKVFAILNGFVANAALGPAVDYLESTGTPMIQTAGGFGMGPLSFMFGLDGPHRGAIDADFVNRYLTELGLPRKVALLRFAQPLDEEISSHQKAALQRLGIEVATEVAVEYGAAMTNQSSVVARMRNSGASMVVGSHGVVCAFNMQAAAQAGWDVPYLCSIFYGDFAVTIADDALRGRDVFADSDGFAHHDRPAPGVEHYRRVLSQYYPTGEIGLITMSSFLGMKVFEEGVASMGDDATRAGLLAFLNGLRDYDAGGLTPPFTVTPDDRVAIRGAYVLRLDEDRRWVPVTPDYVYPDPVHGLPR
jgi:branched-chain amino acid transport system substrate-binding protein